MSSIWFIHNQLYIFIFKNIYKNVTIIDNALKKALAYFYPSLNEIDLSDFKVRIINQVGTASKVRVLTETYDKEGSWGTIGAHENIIVASWDALVDSYVYKLLKEKSNW